MNFTSLFGFFFDKFDLRGDWSPLPFVLCKLEFKIKVVLCSHCDLFLRRERLNLSGGFVL